MDRTSILLIEDDPNLGFILQENLELAGYAVRRCEDGEQGMAACSEESFDLFLIDVMLPKKDGFAIAEEIRRQDEETPIFFLTAKALKEDRIQGFKIGADDYITKPFSLEELILRIQAVLRRSRKSKANDSRTRFQIGSYTFDAHQQTLTYGDKTRKLTAKESELLVLLCQHQDDLLERGKALEALWGEDTYFNGRSMDVFISRLRKYLTEDPSVEIRTIHGQGFRLVV